MTCSPAFAFDGICPAKCSGGTLVFPVGGRIPDEEEDKASLAPWPRKYAVLLDPLRSVQFSSVQYLGSTFQL